MNQCKRRNITNDVKIGVCLLLQNKLRRNLFTDRVASGVELARACCAMKLHEVREKIKRMRHEPVPVQGKWLRSVVQGHLNYFGVPGNNEAIDSFRTEVCKAWLFALRSRSHKSRGFTWERIKRLVMKWLPTAKRQHPYPYQRLRVNYPR